VTIYVHDQDDSLRFFLGKLGFKLVVDFRFAGGRWVAIAPPDGSAFLGLVAPEAESDEYKRVGKSRDVVFVTEDLIAKFNEWSARGVRFDHPPTLAPWGGLVTQFSDVDGNSFVLVGFDALTREIESQRREAAAKMEAERRAAQELEIAKEVQARLFPQTRPPLRTLDYAGICIQARQVGGDYYDFLNLGQERFGLVVGDVSGKGIAGALLMGNLQANVRSQCAIASDQPQRVLRSVNQLFRENTADSSFATLFFGEYDDKSQRLRYANCGHLPALLLRSDDTLERLKPTATILGIFPDWDCSIEEHALFPGDLLALYTDGITEAFDEEGKEEFGEHRLIESLRRHRTLPPQALIQAVVQNVREFSPGEQQDDITVIVAKCRQGTDLAYEH